LKYIQVICLSKLTFLLFSEFIRL